MEKSQYKQIQESLNAIEKAQSSKIYGDCQEKALSLCDFIDKIKNSETKTVSMLVEYCELLFKVNNGELKEKVLIEKLAKISNMVRAELKSDILEVVFLPYRAAMFDALESVYFAASADPFCNAYVIPIPYYEINRDKTLGVSHYDGKIYPPNITITHWEDYDIPTRRPDIIFTHVPYDDFGNNFTIHPNYYHKNLRQFCDKVVYIPYYVHGESSSGSNAGFATTPGPIHAHHTILENENIRQFYISVYKELGKDQGKHAADYLGNLDKKFLALGSPKYDKIINLQPEDCNLPEAWKKLIYKPNATRKKVILYNTHWSPFVNNSARYFKKVLNVFADFQKRDDVVLWWRPHPNCEKNFRTFRPENLNAYLELVSTYKKEAWGIYDDTPDLHRAIACTDAYYGSSESSLTAMYNAAAKPFLIENIELLPTKRNVIPVNICDTKEHLVFSAYTINSLFCINKSDGKVKSLGDFPHEPAVQLFQYGQSASVGDVIYFAPLSAQDIASYSLTDLSFNKISYNRSGNPGISNRAFYGVVVYDKYVYFTPWNHPSIMRLNTETNEITYFDDWIKPIEKFKHIDDDLQFLDPIIVGETMYLAYARGNAVLALDINTLKFTVYEVGQKGYRYSNICYDGDSYWLIPRMCDTPLIKWHPQKGILNEINSIHEKNEPTHKYSMCTAAFCNGYLWLLPIGARHAYKVDVTTNEVHVLDDFASDCNEIHADSPLPKFNYMKSVGDSLYITKVRNGEPTLIQYDTKNLKKHVLLLQTSAEDNIKIEKLISRAIASENAHQVYFYESGSIFLADFISGVVDADTSKRTNPNFDGNAGANIYEYFRRK
ncbi:MAG: hypothetical protein FWF78_10790 [Defluviitaleaceae bacterium]|nr:hypothetical protein [Defluviitaleaceae bacterium]